MGITELREKSASAELDPRLLEEVGDLGSKFIELVYTYDRCEKQISEISKSTVQNNR